MLPGPDVLTPKQRRFVEEYLVDRNGAAAAVRAGYSITRARVTASELRQLPAVAHALDAAETALRTSRELSSQRVLLELVTLLEQPCGDLRASDKVKLIELAGKRLGLWIEKHEHSGPGGGPMKYVDEFHPPVTPKEPAA